MPHQGVMQGMTVLILLISMGVMTVLCVGSVPGCLPGNNPLRPGDNRTDKHHQQGETAKPVCQRKEKPIMQNKILPVQIWRNSHVSGQVFQCDINPHGSFCAIFLILRKNNHQTDQTLGLAANFYKNVAINIKQH